MGTGLRKVLNSLISPTKGAASALKSAGLSVKDFKTQSGALKPVNEIFKTLNEHTQKMSQTEQGAFFHALFGTTGQQAGQILAQNYKQMDDLIKKEKEGESYNNSYVHKLAKKNMQTAQMQLKRLEMAGQDMAINIGMKVLPAVTKVTKALSDWTVSKQGRQAIKDFTNGIQGIAKTVANHAKDITSFFNGFIDGAKGTLKALRPIKDFFNWIGKKLGGGKKGNSIAKWAGIAAGSIAAIYVPLRILKRMFQGAFALGKDLGSLKNWWKGTRAIKDRNTYMERMIELQEESLSLTKQQLELDSQTNSKTPTGNTGGGVGQDWADSILDEANSSSSEEKITRKAEQAGGTAGSKAKMGFFKRFREARKGNIRWREVLHPNKAKVAGEAAGVATKTGFWAKFKSGMSKLKPTNWFKHGRWAKAGSVAGEAAGAGASKGIFGKIKGGLGKLKGLGGTGMSLFDKGFMALGLAGNALDIVGAIKKKNSNAKWSQMGSGFAGLMGAGIGMVFGGAPGAALGQLLGTQIGKGAPYAVNIFKTGFKGIVSIGKNSFNVFGDYINGFAKTKSLIFQGKWKEAFENVKKSGKNAFSKFHKWIADHGGLAAHSWAHKTVAAIKKGDWKGAGKNAISSFQNAMKGFGSWWDKNIMGKVKKSSKKKPKKKSTARRIKSLGGNHYSKKDIAQVKSMNSAIKSYTNSLAKLKATIKKNDPTKELNDMNKALIGHTKGWSKAASPIKKIGDAFSTLAKFTSNMVKKDVFKVFNDDLPKLDSTLKKHSKGIKKGLKDLDAALKSGSKKGGLVSHAKSLSDAFDTLKSSASKLSSPMKDLAGSFKTLQKAMHSLVSGKTTEFEKLGKGLDKMQTTFYHVLKGKNSVPNLLDKLSNSIKNSKLADNLSKIETPLKTIKSYLSDLQKPLDSISTSVYVINKDLAGWKSGKNPLDAMAEGFNSLNKSLGNVTGKNGIAPKLKEIADAFGTTGKKGKGGTGFVASLKAINDPLKDMASSFKGLSKPISSFASAMSKLGSTTGKTNPLSTFAKGLGDIKKVLGGGKKGSTLIKELEELSDALGSVGGGKKKKSTGFVATLKAINSPLNDITKNLKKLKSPFSSITKDIGKLGKGKKTPLSAFVKDLKDLQKTLGGKKKNNIVASLKELNEAFGGVSKGGKGKKSSSGLVSSLTKLNKPLAKVVKAFKKLRKPLATFNKAMKPFTGKSKKGNPLENMADGFKKLSRVLKTGKSSVVKGIKEFSKALSGGSGKGKTKSLATLLQQVDKPLKSMSKYFSKLQKPITKVNKGLKSFNQVLNAFKTKKSDAIANLTADVKALYKALTKYPFGTIIQKQAGLAKRALTGNSFARVFQDDIDKVVDRLTKFRSTFHKDWKSFWNGLNAPAHKGLDKVDTTAYREFKSIQNRRASFSKTFLSAWKSFISQVQSSFRSGMNRLPGYAQSAMKSIVSKLNAGIGGVNKVIGEFGGDKKLSTISYANGTRDSHPGGHMLVNDSKKPHWKELVKFPGKPWTMFDQKNTFIPNAPKGTQVLNGDQTYSLMSRHGVYAYEDGTLDPDKALKLMDEIDKNPLKALKKYFYAKANFSGSPVVSSLGGAMANAFLNSIKNPFKKAIDEFGGAIANPGGAGVTRWIPYIKRAAKVMHVNLTAAGLSKILSNMAHESGGNPRIIQNPGVWDINMAMGNPAKGLFQFIPQTFKTYAMRGHGNIFSGYDQILALFNDANWFSDIAPGGGWSPSGARRFANGGYSFTHKLAEISEGNKPEAIIPLDLSKRPRALQLMSEIIASMQGDSAAPTVELEAQKQRKQSNSKLDTLIALLTEVVTGDQIIQTDINIDGRKMAKALNKYSRRENAKSQFKGNRGFSV